MNGRKSCQTIGFAVASGLFLSIIGINTHFGKITLSGLVVQLSGSSRGDVAFDGSLPVLIDFAMRMVPTYLYYSVIGVSLYCHFCTASVYVFSRYPKRFYWYVQETGEILINSLIYELFLISTIIAITASRFHIIWDEAGAVLLLYHFFLQVMWVYFTAVLMNLLAIRFGSHMAYLIVVGSQMVFVTMLRFIQIEERVAYVIWNPIAHLVISLHWSEDALVSSAFTRPIPGLSFSCSFCVFISIAIIITILGGICIMHHDLLRSDIDIGGI